MIDLPRVIIAGVASGVGKTTIATGLMSALIARGKTVQPFKVGPDYIDPTYHTQATGRISRNVDTWLLPRRTVQGLFQWATTDADCAVIEGVMGLFDGASSTHERGSTAEVAKLLQVPVILVVDARAMARSVSAVVHGFSTLDPEVQIAGVIFNHVSEPHFDILRAAIEHDTNIPVLGYVPRGERALPERHLGLVPTVESEAVTAAVAQLGALAETVDVDHLWRIMTAAPSLAPARMSWGRRQAGASARIGVARDAAFHFYYEENLELLRRLGAELIMFSPLDDTSPPQDLDALYLGGGFPEVCAERLAHNRMRAGMYALVQSGIPTYAECGGLMYLSEGLVDQEGRTHAMVGVLPGMVRMTGRLQHFGYVTLIPKQDTVLGACGDRIKGHEFHYSAWDYDIPSAQSAYDVQSRRGQQRTEGFTRGNILASYVHVHFLTNTRWARRFVAAAQSWNRQRRNRIDTGKPVVRDLSPAIAGTEREEPGAAPQL